MSKFVVGRERYPVSFLQVKLWSWHLKVTPKKMSKFLGLVEFPLISLLCPLIFFCDCWYFTFEVEKTPRNGYLSINLRNKNMTEKKSEMFVFEWLEIL